MSREPGVSRALTAQQLRAYEENGYLLLPNYFSGAETDVLAAQLPVEFAEDSPRRITETDQAAVRSVYGSHTSNEVFKCLTRHPRLVGPAMRILGSDVYVYQFKINAKVAFDGDVWQWHQDYIFWRQEDGLPAPRVVNAIVFLNDVNEFNAPLMVIPGSHREGVIGVPALQDATVDAQTPAAGPAWISHLSAKLKYSLDKGTVRRLAQRYGLESLKGPAGTVLFFDSNLVHSSANNISPFDRNMILITFNSVENIPVGEGNARPEFLVSRDYSSILPVADDAMLSFVER
jgi:ectoine hydroxylase-related dioxygenase (phytanoyl-CoA dioxygenase family)